MIGVIFLVVDDFVDCMRFENVLSFEFLEVVNDIGSDMDKSDFVVFFYEWFVCVVMCMDLQVLMVNIDLEFCNVWFWFVVWEEFSKYWVYFMVLVLGVDDVRICGLIFQWLIRMLFVVLFLVIGMYYFFGILFLVRFVLYMLDKIDEFVFMMFVLCFFVCEKEGIFFEFGVMVLMSGLL